MYFGVSQAFAGGLRHAVYVSLLSMVLGGTYASVAHAATPLKKGKPVSASRAALKSEASQMASGIRAADAALSPEELAIAQRVEVGQVACERGVSVNIMADERNPGYFDVQSKKLKFRMVPVMSKTGAIRLEDARAGAVWLQLANKSMLMNQKAGGRFADACMTSSQLAYVTAMEKNPSVGLLDTPKVADVPVVVPVVAAPPLGAVAQ